MKRIRGEIGQQSVSGRPPGHDAGARLAPERSDEELATRLRVAVTRLHRRLRLQSLAGLSPAQASLLGAVERRGAPTLGELAAVEQVQPPTVTRLVAGMEEMGMLVRLQDAADRRVSRVRLSPDGRRVVQRIRSLKTAFLSQRLAQLSVGERRDAWRLVELLEHVTEEP